MQQPNVYLRIYFGSALFKTVSLVIIIFSILVTTLCNKYSTNLSANGYVFLSLIANNEDLEIYTKDTILYNLISDNITNYIYNKLYKKELWNNITFPIGRIMEDYDVMYKVLEKTKKIVCTNKTNYYYLIREGSSINKFN